MGKLEWPEGIMVCIPAYKAEKTLKTFLPNLLKRVPSEKILVVDDASGDNTSQLCREYKIQCLKHEINRGKGGAIDTGFSHILKMDPAVQWIVTMDADGQHAVEDLESFIAHVKDYPEHALCIGKRDMRLGKMPLLRICSNRLTSGILALYCKQPIADSQCGYRIYSTAFLRTITIEFCRFEMESEVILKAAHAGHSIGFVPVQTVYLDEPTSHISHFKDTIRWVRAVLAINSSLKRKQ